MARRARTASYGALARVSRSIGPGTGRPRGERLLANRGPGGAGQYQKRRKVTAVKLSWSRKKPFSPAEQAAALEVNRHSAGRKARTTGAVEQAVDGGAGRIKGVPELPAGLLQRTRDAISAETGVRLDIHAAHADWQTLGRRYEGADPQPGRAFRRLLQAARERAEVGTE